MPLFYCLQFSFNDAHSMQDLRSWLFFTHRRFACALSKLSISALGRFELDDLFPIAPPPCFSDPSTVVFRLFPVTVSVDWSSHLHFDKLFLQPRHLAPVIRIRFLQPMPRIISIIGLLFSTRPPLEIPLLAAFRLWTYEVVSVLLATPAILTCDYPFLVMTA